MKNTSFPLLALLVLSSAAVGAEPPLPKSQTNTYPAIGQKSQAYTVRLPQGYDAADAAPLVIVVPARGQKPSDALRADDWETLADRWGIVLLASTSADRDEIKSALQFVRRQAQIVPGRIYLYGDEKVTPRDLPGVVAFGVRSRRNKAAEAWGHFETQAQHLGSTDPPRTHQVTVVVTGLRSSVGQVAVSLWNRAKGFGDDKNAVASSAASIVGGQAAVTFTVREAGEYAALVLHDRNRNGKMDTSLGFPLEGFGASGNPRIRFGAPGWNECRFAVAPADRSRRVVVKAVYLTGE